MAGGALQVPVLVAAGPVQRILVIHLFVRVEVEPALPAFGLGARVPGDAQHLVAPAGEGDHVLLQRPDAESAADLVVRQLAIGPVGADHEFAVALEEGGLDVEMTELGIVEIPEHGVGGGLLHGLPVVRTVPGLVLLLMAALAGGCADKVRTSRCGLRDGRAGDGGGWTVRGAHEVQSRERDQCGHGQAPRQPATTRLGPLRRRRGNPCAARGHRGGGRCGFAGAFLLGAHGWFRWVRRRPGTRWAGFSVISEAFWLIPGVKWSLNATKSEPIQSLSSVGERLQARALGPASIVFSSPLTISAFRSLAPPTSTPLTNTIGNVGQPVHSFSALRSRQVLR
jgi:hypothetical protein